MFLHYPENMKLYNIILKQMYLCRVTTVVLIKHTLKCFIFSKSFKIILIIDALCCIYTNIPMRLSISDENTINPSIDN